MTPSRARAAFALPAWLAVAASFTPGCENLLRLDDEGEELAKAFTFTCTCGELTQQVGTFSERCERAKSQLLDAVDSDPSSRDLALSLASSGCGCGDIVECYAGLTGAAASGGACADSADCASWACCAPDFALAVVNDVGPGGRTLQLSPMGGAVCCEPEGEATACASCEDYLEAAVSGASPPQICAESYDALDALVDCYTNELSLADCDPECGLPLDLTVCIPCLFDLEICQTAYEACRDDLARPVGD